MLNLPSLTIITPSYNQSSFIETTILSVLSQNYPGLEYIVIDGGSADGTIDIIKKYSNQLIWRSEADNGQADAINKGLRMAHGEIVAFLNSDDYYLPGALLRVGEVFSIHPESQWVTGDYLIVDKENRPIHFYIVQYKRLLRQFSSFALLSFANYIVQPSTFWRRSIMDEVGYFDLQLRITLDYDFWLRLMVKSSPHYMNEKLSAFRVHADSKGGTHYKDQFDEELLILKRYQKSKTLFMLHSLHNILINTVYGIIKK